MRALSRIFSLLLFLAIMGFGIGGTMLDHSFKSGSSPLAGAGTMLGSIGIAAIFGVLLVSVLVLRFLFGANKLSHQLKRNIDESEREGVIQRSSLDHIDDEYFASYAARMTASAAPSASSRPAEPQVHPAPSRSFTPQGSGQGSTFGRRK